MISLCAILTHLALKTLGGRHYYHCPLHKEVRNLSQVTQRVSGGVQTKNPGSLAKACVLSRHALTGSPWAAVSSLNIKSHQKGIKNNMP